MAVMAEKEKGFGVKFIKECVACGIVKAEDLIHLKDRDNNEHK